MLKWTSGSTLGNKNNVRYDPEVEGTDRPNGESSQPDIHAVSTKAHTLTTGTTKGRPRSFDSENANRTANLPFSYTDPVACRRPEYPYLKRLDLQNLAKRKTDLPITKHTDMTSTPNSSSLESHRQSQDSLSRSKSMPRLGSPVSSTSSFGGSKKGILAKVKRVFRRSKGDDGERRSVSQPSSPKSGGLSRAKTKSRDKPKTSDVKKCKASRPELPLTRLARRIELKKSQRKKIDTDKEAPFANSKPLLNVSEVFHDHFAANKETKVDVPGDFEDDHYEGLFRQHQQLKPTFETFKSSSPLHSDDDSGEAFKKVSGLGSIPFYNDQIDKRPQNVPPRYQNSNIPEQVQSSPSQSGRSSSGSVTSHCTSGICQPRLPENIRDSQLENSVRVMGRPRSSYSRISNMSIYEEDAKKHANKTITSNVCDNPTAISQDTAYKSFNHESMDSLMQFAEELAETLETHLDSSDSYHGLEPEMENKDNYPHFETGVYTGRNTINEVDFQTRMESFTEEERGAKVKVEEKDAKLQTGLAHKIPQANIISISPDSPDNSDWSVDQSPHSSISDREQNAECCLNATKMYPLLTETNGYTLKSIDILEETLNGRDRPKIVDEFIPTALVNKEFDKADTNKPFDKQQTMNNVNEIEANPQNSPSLSSVCTQSSSVSSSNSRPFSDGAMAVLKHKKAHFYHKVTNAKNNNNGHSNFQKRNFQFEKENVAVSDHSEEKWEAKDFEWSEIRKSMNTDCIIGMTRQDHLNPEVQEHSMKSVNCSPLRVKSIVHHLEEQIKIKLEGYTRTTVNGSTSQEITPSSEMVCAKKSLSSSAVNEQLLQRNDIRSIKKYEDDDDDMICVQVTDAVTEDYTPQERHDAAATKASFSYHDVEDKEPKRNVISTDVDSLQSASSEVAVISSGGTDHTSRESLGSDTHSICSEVMGGFSSDEAPDFNSTGCESGPAQKQKQRGGKEEMSMSYLAAQITKGFELSSASRANEELQDGKLDRKSVCPQCEHFSSLSLPLAAHTAFDFTEEKGITDVTPPCELVDVNSSPEDFAVSNLEQRKGKSGGRGGLHISQLNQHFEKQADVSKEFALGESKVGANITILKKRDSILSPACKPSSPVKKSVSFKLDKTPTPSTSLSTVSDDVAICEAMSPKQRPKIEGVTQERTLSQQIIEDRSADHTISSDECLTERSPPSKSDSSVKIAHTNSLSGDDLSWWRADCVQNLEFENQIREVEETRLNVQDTLCVNICDRSEVTQIIDKKETSDIVLSKEPKHLPESKETVLSLTIKESHKVVELSSPEISGEVGFCSSRKMIQQIDPKNSSTQGEQLPPNNEKDNAKEKNDALREMSESSSNLYTYNISKNPVNVSNDLLFKGSQDDNIDGLVVDIDISSALSDLVDQVESSGLNCSPVRSPSGSKITSPVVEKSQKGKAKDTMLENLPFWEKNRAHKTPVLRKKASLPKNVKSRGVKPSTMGSIPKKQPLAHGNKNIIEGQNARPKRKTFRYHLVKSSATKTQMSSAKADADCKEASIEQRSMEVPKKNNNMKDTMEQVHGKIELLTKAKPSVAQHTHPRKLSFSFPPNVRENKEDGEKKHVSKISRQPTVVSIQTRRKISKRMLTDPLTTQETKISKESAPINSNTTSPLSRAIQKETLERDRTCQAQSLERERQTLEKSEPVIKDDQNPVTCSSLLAGEQDGFKQAKISSTKRKNSLSLEGIEYSGLIQTFLQDTEVNLGDPSNSSSDQQRSEDDESSDQSFSRPKCTDHVHETRESANESDDTNKSLRGSSDDLTYDVDGNYDVRHWQSQDRYGSASPFRNSCDIPRLPTHHARLCPCNQRIQPVNLGPKFIHEIEAQAQNRVLLSESHRAPKFQTVTRTDPTIDTDTTSNSTYRPGEWLFIATFFLLQVLLHWLHATNK